MLSTTNSASCIYEKAKEYIHKKNYYNFNTQHIYENELFKKLKWYSFINKQRADETMIRKIREKFGDKKDVVILMGDWSAKNTLRNNEPTKGKSIRNVFKKHGYKLYLVDEYRTSKRLYRTGEELINIRGKHNLLGSEILNKSKYMKEAPVFIKEMIKMGYRPTIINRDLNGSLNIRIKGEFILNGLRPPSYLRRGS